MKMFWARTKFNNNSNNHTIAATVAAIATAATPTLPFSWTISIAMLQSIWWFSFCSFSPLFPPLLHALCACLRMFVCFKGCAYTIPFGMMCIATRAPCVVRTASMKNSFLEICGLFMLLFPYVCQCVLCIVNGITGEQIWRREIFRFLPETKKWERKRPQNRKEYKRKRTFKSIPLFLMAIK